MRMWVGLQHVLNDPLGLIYTPVILVLYVCRLPVYYTILVPSRVRISLLQYYYTRTGNEDLHPFSKLSILNCNTYHGYIIIMYIVILLYWVDRLASRTYFLNYFFRQQDIMFEQVGYRLDVLDNNVFQKNFWRGRLIHVEVKSTNVLIFLLIFREQPHISPISRWYNSYS